MHMFEKKRGAGNEHARSKGILGREKIKMADSVSLFLLRFEQPRPQGLLAFQYGGGSGEDPGTQQITCLQRGWRCIQNGGYSERGEKNWVRDAKVKVNN